MSGPWNPAAGRAGSIHRSSPAAAWQWRTTLVPRYTLETVILILLLPWLLGWRVGRDRQHGLLPDLRAVERQDRRIVVPVHHHGQAVAPRHITQVHVRPALLLHLDAQALRTTRVEHRQEWPFGGVHRQRAPRKLL